MPSFDLTMNVMTLLLIVLGAGLFGYILKNRQLKKKQMKILELRKEMVSNHSYILEMQREFVNLEMQLKGIKPEVPVLPLKPMVKDEETRKAEGM